MRTLAAMAVVSLVVLGLAAGARAGDPESGHGHLVGEWSSPDWGTVTLLGDWGGYTGTFGTGPGLLELQKSDGKSYQGTWRESGQRHGTLSFTVADDGKSLSGRYQPDPASTIGGKQGQSFRLTRRSQAAPWPGSPAVRRSDALTALRGEWRGWGDVTIRGNIGGYTDTYRTGPGLFSLVQTGERAFLGTWGESSRRHGTFTATLSGDGKTLSGTWQASSASTIGPGAGGTLTWTRK
jgi:hypothetical protein